jgi:hypothetical protein
MKDEQTSKRSEVTTLLHQLFPIHTSTFTLSSLHAHYSLPPSPPSTLPRLFLDSFSTTPHNTNIDIFVFAFGSFQDQLNSKTLERYHKYIS